MAFKEVGKLKVKSPFKDHPMVAVGNIVYVVDGDKILAYEAHVETIWEWLGKFLGITRQMN